MKKRILSLILAVLMLFTFNIGANAETAVQPRYSYTNSNDAIIKTQGTVLCVDKKGKFWYNNQG